MLIDCAKEVSFADNLAVQEKWEEFAHGIFENILGYSGFYVYEDTNNSFDHGHYYTIVGEELVCIAETTGEHGVNTFIVNVNEDGIREFIHNVTLVQWKGKKLRKQTLIIPTKNYVRWQRRIMRFTTMV